jgi:glycerol-3-phosphate O-acyltransferase/dihydroxyacetone phosphate acyltransferase
LLTILELISFLFHFSYNQSLTDLDQHAVVIKTQLAVLAIVLCLAVDTINPVKIFMHVFPQIVPWHIATLCVSIMVYIFVSELKTLLYFAVKVFFHSILSIFFKDVEVVGLQNVPRYGPVIFTGNHANQFIDGMSMLCTCQRTISYLVAEKSWNRPVVGHLSWALGTVPVKRAQDSARRGKGTVKLSGDSHGETQGPEEEGDSTKMIVEVTGEGTSFTKDVRPKDKIRLEKNAVLLNVIEIESDSILKVEVDTEFDRPKGPVAYDILERVDQSKVYAAVLDKLSGGGCIGIFPEGGSHDRTDLLPLKVGVSLIAYSALERDGINVPIVPVGLNYFHTHRFRGRAIVEFGAPIYINPSTLDGYKEGKSEKRKVCNDLLVR